MLWEDLRMDKEKLEEYINQFVFAEWDLEKQILKIQYENDKRLTLIKEMDFKITSRLGWLHLFAP